MCSSGHNLSAKMHPNCLAAFCVVETKRRVLNAPLFASMGIRSGLVLSSWLAARGAFAIW